MFVRGVAAAAVLVTLLLGPDTVVAATQKFTHGRAALAVEHALPRRRRSRRAPADKRLYHTPDEFAERAGIGRATVWRLMKNGRLRYARFGRARRIPVSEYERLASETQ
jgi:excisionase family DNA binding protein